MALNSNALTTVVNLRTALTRGRTTDTTGWVDTTILEPVINRISAAIERYCDRTLVVNAADVTHVLDGDGRAVVNLFELGAWPIVSLTSVTNLEDSTTIPARATPSDSGYVLGGRDQLAGILRIVGYSTPASPQSLKIIGKFGYSAAVAATATPEGYAHMRALADLERACLEWCVAVQTAPVANAASMSLEGMGLAIIDAALPTRVASILSTYRRLPVW